MVRPARKDADRRGVTLISGTSGTKDQFALLEEINSRPEPFDFYTARALWTDVTTSSRLRDCQLDPEIDVSSRRKGFIDRSVDWISSRFEVGTGTRIPNWLQCCTAAQFEREFSAVGMSVLELLGIVTGGAYDPVGE